MTRGVTHARETYVQRVMKLMRAGAWQRGETGPKLAEEWGLSVDSLKHIAAEASRRVLANEDKKQVRGIVCEGFRKTFQAAVKKKDAKGVATLGDVWTKVTGAREAEEHIHRNIAEDPAWGELRDAIFAALDPYPDAKAAVLSALRQLAEKQEETHA